MEKNNNIIKYISIMLLGGLIMYGAIYFFPQQFSTIVTKTETDVTIVDTGLSASVDKIYDAVVVVSTYNNNQLISSGTGFVYDQEGDKSYILTNAHVIDGGNEVRVTFTDGKNIKTNIIGQNEYEDIAVLEVDTEDTIIIAELGNTEDVKIGDTSFAVGAPLDDAFSWTVTRGIISGKDRMVEVAVGTSQTADYVMNVMQTDTAINSGNSGGPLCNVNGEVIGITTLKLKEEGVEGMGFAIPIEAAIETAEEIMNGESSAQPYLGISMIDFTGLYSYPEFQDEVDASGVDAGVIILSTENGSPASDANLQAGDIIISIEGDQTNTVSYLRYALYKHEPGEEIEITYIRDGKELKATAKLVSNQLTS